MADGVEGLKVFQRAYRAVARCCIGRAWLAEGRAVWWDRRISCGDPPSRSVPFWWRVWVGSVGRDAEFERYVVDGDGLGGRSAAVVPLRRGSRLRTAEQVAAWRTSFQEIAGCCKACCPDIGKVRASPDH